MVKFKEIKSEVVNQGAAQVGGTKIVLKSKNIVALQVMMKSKYCDYLGTITSDNGDVGVIVGANEYTFNSKGGVDLSNNTVVMFPEFCGWELFACSMKDSVLNLCLLKH
jgi:hypothetical protein